MQTFTPKPPAAAVPLRRRESVPARSSQTGSAWFSPLRAPRPEASRNLHIPAGLLGSMGEAYRTDFSRMRFYESPALPAIHAEALTQGSRSFFAPGRFSPGSQPGRRLIGHELSHAAAQSRGTGAGSGILWDAGLEARADREAALAARGERAVSPNAPAAVAGLRPNVPAQGYFTLLPGDYTLDSDGAKAAFTTHKYVHLATSNAVEPELTAYANEFTAPPVVAGALLPVTAPDPGGNTQKIQDLKQSDRQAQLPGQAQLRDDRLRIHRGIADSYAQTLGSANPAFQQNISKAAGADRYAAIGVHSYEGKVALYVADDGAFAVNAQTPEPKEAYMTLAAAAASNNTRGGDVVLAAFPGNQVTVPVAAFPPGIPAPAAPIILQMVRPRFHESFAKGDTVDCGIFANYVCPGVTGGLNDLTPPKLAIERSNPRDAMLRANMLADDEDAGCLNWLFPSQNVRTLRSLNDKRAVITQTADIQEPYQEIRDFEEVFYNKIISDIDGALFTLDGYSGTGAQIRQTQWDQVFQPGAVVPGSRVSDLDETVRPWVTRGLQRQYAMEQKKRYAQYMMGNGAQGVAPVDDIRRVADEQIQYGADDQRQGINSYVSPAVKQGYKISTALGEGWVYHWGGVIAASVGDTLTLENYEKTGELRELTLKFAGEQRALLTHGLEEQLQALQTQQNDKLQFYARELKKTWFFNIQGTQKPGQSFHEKQAATGSYGAANVTQLKP